MKPFSETRLFLLSFSASFFLIALFFLFMVAVTHPETPSSLQADAAIEEVYIPDERDALTLLLIGTEAPDTPAGTFLLLRFDPIGGQVLVVPLCPETVVEHDGKTETLSDAYRYGGAKYTKAALESYLTLPIDRYALLTRNSFFLSAEAVGTIEFDLEEELTLNEGEVAVTLRQGTQLLDGRKIAGLISYEAFSPEERLSMTAALACAVIDQRIDVTRSTLIDKIFETVINLIDTDISYADYAERKEAALQMSYGERPIAKAVELAGSWEDGQFHLYDTSLALLVQSFL